MGSRLILSITSFIFLCTSVVGLSLTIHEHISFLERNRKLMIPFLSTVCGVSGLIFLITFIDVKLSKCCICFRRKKKPAIDEFENGIDNSNVNIKQDCLYNHTETQTEKDPLLYPREFPVITDNINIPKKTVI